MAVLSSNTFRGEHGKEPQQFEVDVGRIGKSLKCSRGRLEGNPGHNLEGMTFYFTFVFKVTVVA